MLTKEAALEESASAPCALSRLRQPSLSQNKTRRRLDVFVWMMCKQLRASLSSTSPSFAQKTRHRGVNTQHRPGSDALVLGSCGRPCLVFHTVTVSIGESVIPHVQGTSLQ